MNRLIKTIKMRNKKQEATIKEISNYENNNVVLFQH
jgi:hypothetical protein